MLPPEVTDLIGKDMGTRVLEIEKGAIRRYAEAVGDPNPLYWNEEYARKSRHGSIIAPPGFFGWPLQEAKTREEPKQSWPDLSRAGYGRVVNGGMEFEFLRPVRVGDTLVASTVIRDIVEREGKSGAMVLVTTETEYVDEKGGTVARQWHTTIHR